MELTRCLVLLSFNFRRFLVIYNPIPELINTCWSSSTCYEDIGLVSQNCWWHLQQLCDIIYCKRHTHTQSRTVNPNSGRFFRGLNPEWRLFKLRTCVMSHQSLSRQAKTKSESPTAVEFGSRTPKSDHGSCGNVLNNYLSNPIYSYLWEM